MAQISKETREFFTKDSVGKCGTNKIPSGVIERIIGEVAEELGISKQDVRAVVSNVFKTTALLLRRSIRKPLKRENLMTIRWFALGSFTVSKWRTNRMFKNKLLKQKKKDNA